MTKKYAYLKPIVVDGVWVGEYECSVCQMRFRPDPSDPGKLSREFGVHEVAGHPTKREDFSQAAARIVREATEGK
jgi:hypothetical protein